MRTQIAIAALVAFAAAQDSNESAEDAIAEVIDEAVANMTDEERAEWEAVLAAAEEIAEDMDTEGDGWGNYWSGEAWSPELEEVKAALDLTS